MIQWLIDFGEWFVDLCDTLSEYFTSILHSFGALLRTFPKMIQIAYSTITHIPFIFQGFITLTVIILIVYLIVNRDAGDTG